MNYRVYNRDGGRWCTYRRDSTGHYDLVHEGLPYSSGYRRGRVVREIEVGEPTYRYETEIKRSDILNPWCDIRDCGRRYRYLFTELETKSIKTRRDVFSDYNGRQIVRKCRPEKIYKTEIFLDY